MKGSIWLNLFLMWLYFFFLQLLGFIYACYVVNTLSHEADSCEFTTWCLHHICMLLPVKRTCVSLPLNASSSLRVTWDAYNTSSRSAATTETVLNSDPMLALCWFECHFFRPPYFSWFHGWNSSSIKITRFVLLVGRHDQQVLKDEKRVYSA